MRIGLVLNSVPNYSETFLINKIRGLQENGHEVIVFAAGKNAILPCKLATPPPVIQSRLWQAWLLVFYLKMLFLKAPKNAIRFFQLEHQSGTPWRQNLENMYLSSHILSKELDWLHFGFGTAAIRKEHTAKAIGAKMAVSFRGSDAYVYPLSHPNCYQKMWLTADKVHIISKGLQTQLTRLGKPGSLDSEVIYPAVDLTKIPCKTEGRWFSKPEKQRLEILTVARLHWIKGLDQTLKALSMLHAKGLTFSFTIIGAGAELERLSYLTKQYSLNDKVVFKGRCSPEQTLSYYQNADLYIQYSLQEGFGNAVLEAQASGLPCIVSDADGLQENIMDGETGWVVHRQHPEALANKIEEVLSLPHDEVSRIVQNARKRVESTFNIKIQQKAFEDFFTS